jgi:predicted lipoprotein with Yx(FWY)xxD motif
MTILRATALPVIGLGAALLAAAAACGSSTGSSAATPRATAGGAGGASTAPVQTRQLPLGTVLTDAQGRTLYTFAADAPGVSHCSGACAAVWPVVPAPGTLPTAVPGVTGTLGAITRTDGSQQLTIDNQPVYTFVGDKAPGQANGQDKNLNGGLWYVVDTAGRTITDEVTGAPAGGGGY